ncbi:MAG: hypothetical protein ACOYXB_00550 [Bacteroidota bacterium]
MNAIELIERLKNDLEIIKAAMRKVRSHERYLDDIVEYAKGFRENDFTLEENWISITLEHLPLELGYIVNLLNNNILKAELENNNRLNPLVLLKWLESSSDIFIDNIERLEQRNNELNEIIINRLDMINFEAFRIKRLLSNVEFKG